MGPCVYISHGHGTARIVIKYKNVNVCKKAELNVNVITIESYHTLKYYKSGGEKNDLFFDELKDDSVGQATIVYEFTVFEIALQLQSTSVAQSQLKATK